MRKRAATRGALVSAVLFVGSLAATILLLEMLLRHVPLVTPRGSYGASRVHPELGLRVHAAAPLYHRVRWTRRAVNPDGFLDVAHAVPKPPGHTRVGFFGDSYVEAVQVPLEQTFFRKLPPVIASRPMEAFAFGISGWGTLHSLVTYRIMGPRYDLDYVVYVFVTNDPGDHHEMARSGNKMWATLTDAPPGFVTHAAEPHDPPLIRRLQAFAERHLILARLIRVQWQPGWWRKLVPRQSAGATAAPGSWHPNDEPSTWPPGSLAEAQLLTRRILSRFRDEVVRDGRRFAVLYVPRGDKDLTGQLAPADDWGLWLTATCADLGIRLLNPREILSRQLAAGIRIYDDHWSPAAHELIASFLAGYLADELAAERNAATPR